MPLAIFPEAVVDRGAALIAAVVRIADDAVLIVHRERRTVARRAVASREIQRILLDGCRLENLILPVDAPHVAIILNAASIAQVGVVEIGFGHDLLLEFHEVVGIHEFDLLGNLGESPTGVEREPRLAGFSEFGGNDYHAVGSPGTVDGRGRGILENVD